MKMMKKMMVLFVAIALLTAVIPAAYAAEVSEGSAVTVTFTVDGASGFDGDIEITGDAIYNSDYTFTVTTNGIGGATADLDPYPSGNGYSVLVTSDDAGLGTIIISGTMNMKTGTYGTCTVTLDGKKGLGASGEVVDYSDSRSYTITAPHVCDMNNLTDVAEVPATCTEDGVKAHKKCDCGKLYLNGAEVTVADLAIAKLGHAWGEWLEVEPATCEEDGAKVRMCTRCQDASEDDVIPALGHAWGEWTQTKAPNCTDKGEETRVCANDASHKETREVAAKGHTWVLQEEGTVKPTKDKDGVKAYKCSVCGATKTEVWKYSKVPSTGDITPVLFLGGFGAFAMIAAAAYVLKRKFAR